MFLSFTVANKKKIEGINNHDTTIAAKNIKISSVCHGMVPATILFAPVRARRVRTTAFKIYKTIFLTLPIESWVVTALPRHWCVQIYLKVPSHLFQCAEVPLVFLPS